MRVSQTQRNKRGLTFLLYDCFGPNAPPRWVVVCSLYLPSLRKGTASLSNLTALTGVGEGPRSDDSKQCCGSGSGIQDPVPFLPLDPGSRIGKKSRSGIRIRDEQPGSYFLELRNHILVKILKFFDADPGSGMERIRVRNPGKKKSDPV